jgi:hypothetical protein
MANRRRKARCIVIAGPNGAGETTFARRYLPEHRVIHFVNADLIASGLSPLRPDLAAIAAGRMLLRELEPPPQVIDGRLTSPNWLCPSCDWVRCQLVQEKLA